MKDDINARWLHLFQGKPSVVTNYSQFMKSSYLFIHEFFNPFFAFAAYFDVINACWVVSYID